MSKPHNTFRKVGVVAVAACGLVALSACSSSGSTGASTGSDSATASTASSTATSTTSSSAASTSSSGKASGATSSSGAAKSSTSSASKSGKASKSSKPTSTKPKVKADPVGACLTANSKSNAAISQWNTAVTSQSSSKLDAAAHNFQSTATSLRKLPAKSQDKGFEKRVKAVANDLDAMAKARFDGKTVYTSTYNKDSGTMRSYCQKLITKG